MKWKTGIPDKPGVYAVKYARAQSSEIHKGFMSMSRMGDGLYPTVFGSRGQLGITYDSRRREYRAPTIYSYAEIA